MPPIEQGGATHDPAMGYQGGCWSVVKRLTAQASMAKAEHRSEELVAHGRKCSQPMSEVARSRDGIPLAFEVHGAGTPTLVLVHGWSCDRSYWRGQLGPWRRGTRRWRSISPAMGSRVSAVGPGPWPPSARMWWPGSSGGTW